MTDPTQKTTRRYPQEEAMPDRDARPRNPFIPFDADECERSISERFEQIVQRYPDRIAVVDGEQSVTQLCFSASLTRILPALLSGATLFDYMAAGIPIASVDMPPARPFESRIHLARRSQVFAQAVRAALADTPPQRCRACREIAAQNPWAVKAEPLSSLIEKRLAGKARKPARRAVVA